MRAPAVASASATARPCPCAAPVMKATLPSNSRAELIEILVQLHFEDVVDDVGSDHETCESRERNDLLRIEKSRELFVERRGDAIAVLRDGPSEGDQHFAFFV